MKIFHSLPENARPADSYLLSIINPASLAFLVVSSVTVFMGVRAWVLPHIAQYNVFLLYLGLVLTFIFLAFMPDYINSRFVTFLTKTILGKEKGVDTYVLLGVSVLFCGLLTTYSFTMSRTNGGVAAQAYVGEAELIDLSPIEGNHRSAVAELDRQQSAEITTAISGYEAELAALIAPLQASIVDQEADIATLEKSRAASNTSWTDKQIGYSRQRIINRNQKIAALTADYRSKMTAAEKEIRNRYAPRYEQLETEYSAERSGIVQLNDRRQTKHDRNAAIVVGGISWLSGWSVLFFVFLKVISTILYHRNGVNPSPAFSSFDFQPSVWVEVVAFPFVWCERKIVNAVRRGYNGMEAIEDRRDLERVKEQSIPQTITRKSALDIVEKGRVIHSGGRAIALAETSTQGEDSKDLKQDPETGRRPIGFRAETMLKQDAETNPVSELKQRTETAECRLVSPAETAPETTTAETAQTVVATRVPAVSDAFVSLVSEIETRSGFLQKVKDLKRKMQRYYWKLENPGNGRPETAIRNIYTAMEQISVLTEVYYGQIQDDAAELKQTTAELLEIGFEPDWEANPVSVRFLDKPLPQCPQE